MKSSSSPRGSILLCRLRHLHGKETPSFQLFEEKEPDQEGEAKDLGQRDGADLNEQDQKLPRPRRCTLTKGLLLGFFLFSVPPLEQGSWLLPALGPQLNYPHPQLLA